MSAAHGYLLRSRGPSVWLGARGWLRDGRTPWRRGSRAPPPSRPARWPRCSSYGCAGPDLAAELDPPGPRPVIRSVTMPCCPTSLPWPSESSGPLCSRLTSAGRTSARQRDRATAAAIACTAKPAPSSAATIPTRRRRASISRIRSRLNISATPRRIARPSQDAGEVVAEPVHGRTLVHARGGSTPPAPPRATSARRGRAASTSGIPNVAERFCSVSTCVEQPGRDHPRPRAAAGRG